METYNADLVNSGDISLETILSEGLEIPNYEDYLIFKEGFVVSLKGRPRLLKEAKGGYKRHYSFVVLCKDGKTKPHNIHTLVATMFVEKPTGKSQVNHIDGNTDNNHYSNLEWVTPQENSRHAMDTGLSPTGEKCPWAKHTEKEVRQVCSMLQAGYSTTEIRLALRLDSRFVSKIKSRTNWKRVSKDYDF